jgi:hypothetical protein
VNLKQDIMEIAKETSERELHTNILSGQVLKSFPLKIVRCDMRYCYIWINAVKYFKT